MAVLFGDKIRSQSKPFLYLFQLVAAKDPVHDPKLLEQVSHIGMLILDDWGMEMLDASERSNLLEIIDTRYGKVSTIVASQLPVEKWYGMIGEATFAEAILDRLIHRAVRVTLTGESMRKQGANLTEADQAE